MTNREKVELHKKWWKRQNAAPLVSHYFPVKLPFGGLDIDVPPEQIGIRKKANAAIRMEIPGDTLIVESVNFGPAIMPALAGAGFDYDEHSSWSKPAFDSAKSAKIKTFDPKHPIFEKYLRRLTPLLENWSWDTYLPSLADYLGPMDIVAGILGPETLAFETYENPDDVRRLALDAAKLLSETISYEIDLHRQAGMTEGVTDVFSVWLPGRGVRLSEDFSALVGPAHFKEFFIEADSAVCSNFDSIFMHVHSSAIQCVSGFLDVQGIGAIEFGNDPNGPGLDSRIETAKLIQSRGKALQFGSWNIPLPENDLQRVMNELAPAGLLLRFQMPHQT